MGAIYNLGARMCHRREDADDLVQNTFLNAFRYLGTFRGEARFRNWLFRIAHNLVIDRARRNKRHISLQTAMGDDETNTLEDHLPSPGISPAEEVGGSHLGERIEAAVQILSPEQKEVFLMRMYANTSFKEIAKIQKCSINTCLARMQYSLTMLRSILKDEYAELQEALS